MQSSTLPDLDNANVGSIVIVTVMHLFRYLIRSRCIFNLISDSSKGYRGGAPWVDGEEDLYSEGIRVSE